MPDLPDLTFGKLEEKRSLLSALRHYMEIGITEAQERDITTLLSFVFAVHQGLERQEVVKEIQRVTINRRILRRNARLHNISYLKYPPAQFAGYGRCNVKNQSVLYAGFDYVTILSELKPEVGDLITISYWENKAEHPMRCNTIVGHQPAGDVINPMTFRARSAIEREINKYPPNLRSLFTAQIEFLADAFSRRVAPRPVINYLFSAYFASKLLGPEMNFDAINYASVQQRLSLNNIAIRADVFDRLFELKEAKEMIVVGSPYGETGNFGGMFSHGTASAREADANGRLIWVNYASNEETTRIVEEFGISFDEN